MKLRSSCEGRPQFFYRQPTDVPAPVSRVGAGLIRRKQMDLSTTDFYAASFAGFPAVKSERF